MRARHSSRHVFGSARAERNDDTVGRIRNPESANQMLFILLLLNTQKHEESCCM